MKTILLSIAIVMTTAGAYAQSDSTKRVWNQSENKYNSDSENQHHPDGFLYQDGNLLLVRNGKTTRVERDTTLTNGIVITSDGNYTKKGGTKTMFKEGEHMDLAGNITLIHSSRYGQGSKSQNYPDGYLYQNGKVVLVTNGETTPVDEDITLTNGTVITSNGNYTVKGGTITKFKEGEHMDLSGKIVQRTKVRGIDGKEKPNKSLHPLRDSTNNKPN